MKLRTFQHTSTLNVTGCVWLDQTRLVSCGTDALYKVWDANTGQLLDAVASNSPFECVVARGGRAYFGLTSGLVLSTSGFSFATAIGRITAIAVTGTAIAVAGVKVEDDGRTVCRLALFGLDGKPNWERIIASQCNALEFSEGGELLFVSGNTVLYKHSSTTSDILDQHVVATDTIMDLQRFGSELAVGAVNDGDPVNSLIYCGLDTEPHGSLNYNFPSGVQAISWSPDGSKLAVGPEDYRVMVFPRQGNAPIYVNEGKSIAAQVAWHPTNPALFAVARRAEGTIEIHDLQPEPVVAPTPPPVSKPGHKHK